MERPFYVSDEVLNTALVGINNKPLERAAIPAALQDAAAAIDSLGQDPADTAWALTGLVFAYESAYNSCEVNTFTPAEMAQYRAAQGQAVAAAAAETSGAEAAESAGEDDAASVDAAAARAQGTGAQGAASDASAGTGATLVTRIKLHQGPLPVAPCSAEPAGQRYLSAALLAELNAQRQDQVAWLAILARLQGTGLKVPQEHLMSYFAAYFGLRSRLNSLYAALPLEFLSTRAHYLLPYMSATAARESAGEVADAEEETVALDAEPGTAAWYEQITRYWRHGSVAERKGAVATLLQRYELGRALDLMEPDFKTLSAKERADLIGLLASHWIAQLTHCYQTGLWTADGALPQRLATWLKDLAAQDRAATVKQAAAALLRLLPLVGRDEEMTALARTVFVASWRKGHLARSYGVDVTSEEVVTPLCTLFPELKEALEYRKKYPKSYQHNEEFYFDEMTFLLPPTLWFELFKLERSGDEAADADLLFKTFAQYFPGWDVQRAKAYQGWQYNDCIPYLITRIRFELGPVYLKAFYQHCGSHLPYSVLQNLITGASYAERELLPFVQEPEIFKQVSAKESNLMWLTVHWAEALCTEPAHCWGPKFSAFYADLLLSCFESNTLAKVGNPFYYTKYLEPSFSALGLGLDPEVKAQFVLRLKQRIMAYKAEIAEREELARKLADAKAREDIALRERYEREMQWRDNSVTALQHMLKSCTHAEYLKQLCAAEVTAARSARFEA